MAKTIPKEQSVALKCIFKRAENQWSKSLAWKVEKEEQMKHKENRKTNNKDNRNQ